MKQALAIAVVCGFCGINFLAAESVSITSQYSSIGVSSSLYRSSGNGSVDLVVTRTANDDSPMIGDRSAQVEVVAASGGVAQSSSASAEIEVIRQPEESTIHVASSLAAAFSQEPDSLLRSGSTWVEGRSSHNFRFLLDRPHNVAVSLTPTGNRSLNADGTVSVNSYNTGDSTSMRFSLSEAGTRTFTILLERGEHELATSTVTASGFGSFNADNGDNFLLDGDVGMTVTVVMVAIGQTPVVSGRIEIRPPAGGRISLVASGLQPGKYYELERTGSLTNPQWVFVRNFSAASAGASFSDTFDPDTPSAFYRLRQSP